MHRGKWKLKTENMKWKNWKLLCETPNKKIEFYLKNIFGNLIAGYNPAKQWKNLLISPAIIFLLKFSI